MQQQMMGDEEEEDVNGVVQLLLLDIVNYIVAGEEGEEECEDEEEWEKQTTALPDQTPLLWAEFGHAMHRPPFKTLNANPHNCPQAFPPSPTIIELMRTLKEDIRRPLLPIAFFAYVQSIDSPFYFHLLPFTCEKALKHMDKEMNGFYNNENPTFSIPPEEMEQWPTGMAVAARMQADGKWYRATLLDRQPLRKEPAEEGQCWVHYEDWGNDELLPCNEIKPLIARFARLPPLAFECRITEIRGNTTSIYPQTPEMTSTFSRLLIDECDSRVRVHLQSLHGPPYTVNLFMLNNAESTGAGNLITRGQQPMSPEQKTDEAIRDRHAYINDPQYVFNYEQCLQRRLDTLNTPIVPPEPKSDSDSEDEQQRSIVDGCFVGTRKKDMTDEEYKEHVLLVWASGEEEWRQNRKRQRVGPSTKVIVANLRIAKMNAAGLGGGKLIDWEFKDGRPWTKPTNFSRVRVHPAWSPYVMKIRTFDESGEKFRPLHEDVFITHIGNARHVWLQCSEQVEDYCLMIEMIQMKCSDEPPSLSPADLVIGRACIVRDAAIGHRFARVEVIKIAPNYRVIVRNVDLGHELVIPWADLDSLKCLPKVPLFDHAPFSFMCKLRSMCELSPDPMHRVVLNDLAPVGSQWLLVNDLSTKKPPFRVSLIYRNYPDDYSTGNNNDLKELFDDAMEERTGHYPEYVDHPWKPRTKAEKRWNKMDAMMTRMHILDSMEPVQSSTVKEMPKSGQPGRVTIEAISSPLEVFFRPTEMSGAFTQLTDAITEYYEEHTATDIFLDKAYLRSLNYDQCRLHKPVVLKYEDQRFYRGEVVEERKPPGFQSNHLDVKEYRVRYTDVGSETDWIGPYKTIYQLLPQFRDMYPKLVLSGCLDGFEKEELSSDEVDHLTTRLDSWLFSGEDGVAREWYAFYWKKSGDDAGFLISLHDTNGASVNDALMKELLQNRQTRRRH